MCCCFLGAFFFGLLVADLFVSLFLHSYVTVEDYYLTQQFLALPSSILLYLLSKVDKVDKVVSKVSKVDKVVSTLYIIFIYSLSQFSF